MKDKEHLIEGVKNTIRSLFKKQDELYAGLLEAIGEISEEQESWLWDYCYNCHEDSEYTQMVRYRIYGCENND
jgi:hypothetical protein